MNLFKWLVDLIEYVNQYLEKQLENYQYPEEEEEDQDDSWLKALDTITVYYIPEEVTAFRLDLDGQTIHYTDSGDEYNLLDSEPEWFVKLITKFCNQDPVIDKLNSYDMSYAEFGYLCTSLYGGSRVVCRLEGSDVYRTVFYDDEVDVTDLLEPLYQLLCYLLKLRDEQTKD